jgi:hypothetical protein
LCCFENAVTCRSSFLLRRLFHLPPPSSSSAPLYHRQLARIWSASRGSRKLAVTIAVSAKKQPLD